MRFAYCARYAQRKLIRNNETAPFGVETERGRDQESKA